MMTIQKLPEEVINQIAAGEVVESPASLLKELLENSLDAGAESITIHSSLGGIEEISVEDDGCGMNPKDALASLERHATSKIRTADDLFHLKTMGFRGEALAAISAVSELELLSNAEDIATKIVVSAGTILTKEVAARSRGTTITVRSLFFNTPARKKFLKSPAANTAAIRRVVQTLALAHPHIHFKLISNGSPIFQVLPSSPKERIEEILGPFAYEVQYGPIWGFLSHPQEAKSHRKEQYLFINRRPIFSPLVSHAVKMGYQTRLKEHTHPPFVLFFEAPKEEIDINIHPQKKEVRFADEKRIFSLFEHAASKALAKESLPTFSTPLTFEEPRYFPLANPSDPHIPLYKEEGLPLDFEPSIKIVALLEHFLIFEDQGLHLVNLHIAQERLLLCSFEDLDQRILLTAPLQITGSEELLKRLQLLHIQSRAIGKQTLLIESLPSWFPEDQLELFVSLLEKAPLKKIVKTICSKKQRYTYTEALSLYKAIKDQKDLKKQLTIEHLQRIFQEVE